MNIFEGIVIITLKKPFKYDGQDISEVCLDFGKTTAKMMIAAERETFNNGNISTIIRNMSSEYCAHIAASISGVKYDALMKLRSADFDAVWQTVSAYFNNRDPQEFYNQYTRKGEDDDILVEGGEAFMLPAPGSEPEEE
ncbi:MAG: phage tail assembly protein [Clostridiales bacterium]|jgi:hypothetical protein|nr:phage tail assembly protein [Clostridiales bacterium]